MHSHEGTPEHSQAKAVKKATFGTEPWNNGIKDDEELFEDLDVLHDYLRLVDQESKEKKAHKKAQDALHQSLIKKYPTLTEAEIKALAVHDRWFTSIQAAIERAVQQPIQQLASRIKELEERYAHPLPELEQEVGELRSKVEDHLKDMGHVWT